MGPKEIQHLLGHSDPPAGEMIRRLLADNQRMADRQFAAIEMCDSRGDTPNGNMLQDVLGRVAGWRAGQVTIKEPDHGSTPPPNNRTAGSPRSG